MNKVKIAAVLLLGVTLTLFVPTVYAQATATPTITTRGGALKDAAITRAKEIATNIFTNQYLARLNALRARVSANEKLGSEAKQAILSKIDAEITWFTTKKDSISSLNTVANVRILVNESRTRFLSISKEVRRLYISSGFVVSLDKVVSSLEKNIIPKIEVKLVTLAAEGKDIQTEQALLVKAKAEVASAKASITLIRNSTTFETAKKNFDNAKTHLMSARQYLKELLTSLKTKL